MYLWAALFAVTVVSLSVVRTKLLILAGVTLAGVLILLLVSVPRLRPHRRVRLAVGGASGAPVPGAAASPLPVGAGTLAVNAAGYAATGRRAGPDAGRRIRPDTAHAAGPDAGRSVPDAGRSVVPDAGRPAGSGGHPAGSGWPSRCPERTSRYRLAGLILTLRPTPDALAACADSPGRPRVKTKPRSL